MNDPLQQTAFNYGRYSEKLRRTNAETNEEAYREYDALCMSLWRELKENDATDGANLKPEYMDSLEAGRDSVVEY